MTQQLKFDFRTTSPLASDVTVPMTVRMALDEILKERRCINPDTSMRLSKKGRLIAPYSAHNIADSVAVIRAVEANQALRPYVRFIFDDIKYKYDDVVFTIEKRGVDLVQSALKGQQNSLSSQWMPSTRKGDTSQAMPIIITPPLLGFDAKISSYSSGVILYPKNALEIEGVKLHMRVDDGLRSTKIHPGSRYIIPANIGVYQVNENDWSQVIIGANTNSHSIAPVGNNFRFLDFARC